MAAGLLKNITDLDTLFMARVNPKIADVKIQTGAGVDISNRYEALGGGTPIANTGFKTGAGVDIATLFRNISEPLVRVDVIAVSRHKVSIAPTDAEAGFRLLSTGNQESGTGTSSMVWLNDGPWLISGAASDYEVRVTVTSGPNPSSGPAPGTWLNLGTTRQWFNQATGAAESLDTTMTVEIRDAVTHVVLDSATVEIWADTEV